MADETIGLGVGVKSTADNSGFDTAAKGAKGTEDALKGASTAADTAKTAFTELAAALGLMIGLAELVSFFKDATEEAYKQERALRGVAQAALIFGGDMKGAKEEADRFTHALSIQTGVMDDELLDAYAKVYLATGKVTEAQKETTLAANLAAVRHIDMATALRLVESAATGVPGRFDRIVGGVTEGTTAFEKHESMTRRLISAYGDVSKVTNDAAMATDRASRRWDQFKETIGGPVLEAIGAIKDKLALLPRTLELVSDLMVIHFQNIGRNASALWEFLGNLKNFQDPIASWKAYQAGRLANEVITDHAIVQAREEAQARFAFADKAATVAAVKELDFRGKKEKAAVDEFLRTKITAADAEARHADAVERQLDDATVEGVNKRLAEARREEKEEETLANKKLAAMLKAIEEEERAHKEAFIAEQERQKAQMKGEIDVANHSIALGTELFGQNKELAIAQAVVNTYQAAAGALAAQPVGWWNIALAVLMIAEGLAQVAKIESTDVKTSGSGFDDPSNDRSAYMGGRKWAKDMIDNFSSGVSQGWASGMGAGGSTTNNNSSMTINVSGGLIDPNSREWMKTFGRRLAIVMQQDGNRNVARRT